MTALNLRDVTTLRVGGPATDFIDAVTTDDIVEAVVRADAHGTPLLIIGGGSNLVVADDGFAGTVIRIATTGTRVAIDGEHVTVTVAAGTGWDALVDEAVASGWAGLECLSGIPGRVGATPIQNVGAYGTDVSAVIQSVTVLDRRDREVRELTAQRCEFGYRSSAFKRSAAASVVLDVTFRLTRSATAPAPAYADVLSRLGVPAGSPVPLRDIRDAVLAVRSSKGMVLDDADHDTWSVGSFFVNPFVDAGLDVPDGAPRWEQPDGRVKTSAAWLIEHAGFTRGWAPEPGFPASLSTKHTLAITNRGSASAADVLVVARAIRDGVRARFGIGLEPEARLVNCSL